MYEFNDSYIFSFTSVKNLIIICIHCMTITSLRKFTLFVLGTAIILGAIYIDNHSTFDIEPLLQSTL